MWILRFYLRDNITSSLHPTTLNENVQVGTRPELQDRVDILIKRFPTTPVEAKISMNGSDSISLEKTISVEKKRKIHPTGMRLEGYGLHYIWFMHFIVWSMMQIITRAWRIKP